MSDESPAFSREDLYEWVWREPASQVARRLGLSAAGLAKICDRLDVPRPSRGFWVRRGEVRPEARPPLPPAPRGAAISGVSAPTRDGRSSSRRPRSRLHAEARRDQLLDAAARLVRTEGVHAATLRRLAGDIGVSEALVQRYFPRQDDLLAALASRELAAIDAAQAEAISRGADRAERVALSTQAYLRQARDRGALLQVLLSHPGVRLKLREARAARAADRGEAVASAFTAESGVDADLARGTTAILSALSLRAGALVARGRLSLDESEPLALAMIRQANRRIARGSRRRRDDGLQGA